MGSEADITPSLHLTDLAPKIEPLPADGPVLIQIEYQIDPSRRREFLRAIQAVGGTRRRNGAASWRVYRDIRADGRFGARVGVTWWSEYPRLRTRMTVSDRTLQERVEAMQ